MKNVRLIKSTIVFGLALAVTSVVAQTEGFCSTNGYTGDSTKITSNEGGVRRIGNFDYEFWYEGSSGATAEATFYSDGSMKCSFTAVNDALCRIGMVGPGKIYSELNGDLISEFSLDAKNMKGANYAYMGAYGWMVDVPVSKNGIQHVEFFVVDNWPGANRPGAWVGNEVFGDYMIDGAVYSLYSNVRTGPCQFSESGKTLTYMQYFSIRKTPRDCGTINISAHMRKWESIGLKLGKIYDAMNLVEVGGSASGTTNFRHSKVYIGAPYSPENIVRQPYGGTAAVIPGIIEAENFDDGNEGVSYFDVRGISGEDRADYRNDYAVDIMEGGSAYVVGFPGVNEWLEYTVDVEEESEYDVTASVYNAKYDGKLTLTMDDTNTVILEFKAQKDSVAYEEAPSGKMSLTTGSHILRITFNNDNTSVDYVKFTLAELQESSSSAEEPASSSSAEEPASSSSSEKVDTSSSSEKVDTSSSSEKVDTSSSSEKVDTSSSSEKVDTSSSSEKVDTSSSSEKAASSSSSKKVSSSSSSKKASSSSSKKASSSSSKKASSSSSSKKSSSSRSDAIHSVVAYQGVVGTYQVFDMLGKFMGSVDLAEGASVAQLIKAKFGKAGVYMVKSAAHVFTVFVK